MRFLGVASLAIAAWIASAYAVDSACHQDLTSDPPFYLTSVSKSRTETFKVPSISPVVSRDGGVDQISSEILRKNPRLASNAVRIDRGSIVRALKFPSEARDLPSDSLIHVEVTNNAGRYDAFRTGRQASKGDQGFIPYAAISPLKDSDVFVVNRNTWLLSMSDLKKSEIPEGYALAPAMQGSMYKIWRCGQQYSYIFHSFDPAKPTVTRDVAFDCATCSDLTAYTAPHFDELTRLQNFTNKLYGRGDKVTAFDVNDWGLVRLPMEEPPKELQAHDITGIAKDGSFIHYQGSDPKGSDIWGDPSTVCALMVILRGWQDKCRATSTDPQACVAEVGDIAFVTPARLAHGQDDPLKHHYHYTGYCIDVRPFKKTADVGTVTAQSSSYDLARTKDFIRYIESQGATPIYFTDRRVYMDPEIGGGNNKCSSADMKDDVGHKVQPCGAEHTNHIHFCLMPEKYKGLGC